MLQKKLHGSTVSVGLRDTQLEARCVRFAKSVAQLGLQGRMIRKSGHHNFVHGVVRQLHRTVRRPLFGRRRRVFENLNSGRAGIEWRIFPKLWKQIQGRNRLRRTSPSCRKPTRNLGKLSSRMIWHTLPTTFLAWSSSPLCRNTHRLACTLRASR